MFSHAVGREEHCKQISFACVGCAVCLGHTGFALAHGVCAFPVYTAQAPGCSAGELWVLGCMHFPGLSLLVSGFRVLQKAQTRLGLPFVAFPGPSSSGDQVLDEHTLPRCSVLLPPHPSCSVSGYTAGAPSQVCCVSPQGS